MAFELPPLPYPYDALAPTIDEETMRLHHDLHHKAYITNANNALEGKPELANRSAEDVLDHFGWIGTFFAMDLEATSTSTRELLGWTPSGRTLFEDLAAGAYSGSATPAAAADR